MEKWKVIKRGSREGSGLRWATATTSASWDEPRLAGRMKGLLLSAALAIVCWLDFGAGVPVQAQFDVQQLAGRWYAVAVVKTNGPPENILILDHIVKPKRNGDLLLRTQFPVKNQCREEKILLKHTHRAAVYTAETKEVFSVVETDYDSYYILHIEMSQNSILQLFARKPELSTMVENMYLSRARSFDFDIKLILHLDTINRCP